MLTFQELYEESQEQVQDTSPESLVIIKRAINNGAKLFGAILNRDWRVSEKRFSTTANQQYYQLPEDAIRLKTVTITVGATTYPLTEIADADIWDSYNESLSYSNTPEFFFVKGDDQFGIWPIPSSTIVDGGTIRYERRMRDMSAADYSAGTISIVTGSYAVSGAATTFTQDMVGRYLKIEDPAGDGMWQRISGYTSAVAVSIENNYSSPTINNAAYRIGEIPDIPEEFHENLIDYACFRYYLRRRDVRTAKEMRSLFIDGIALCQSNYGSKTSSQYTRSRKRSSGYVHKNKDYTVT
jgi:hypothetical protein